LYDLGDYFVERAICNNCKSAIALWRTSKADRLLSMEGFLKLDAPGD
jgi:hypothetical protein